MNWNALLAKDHDTLKQLDMAQWFAQIARQLLAKSRLIAGETPHRFMEIEFYYNGAVHPDVFAHSDPLQKACGLWYFHRTGGRYRGGSFKGLDLTFAAPDAYAGILIRSIETPDGTLIDGPSLCVDHLLRQTGYAKVADLDKAIAARKAWDSTNPLSLSTVESDNDHLSIQHSARVGLSLKKAELADRMYPYIMRRYRFLVDPHRIRKGKVYLVLALYIDGMAPEKIQQTTKSPLHSIHGYIREFEEGRQQSDFSPYLGKDLSAKVLARLSGTWHRVFGKMP